MIIAAISMKDIVRRWYKCRENTLLLLLYKKPSESRGSEASLYNKEESKLFYSSEGNYADRKVAPFQDPGG